jgi:hypothetical protein
MGWSAYFTIFDEKGNPISFHIKINKNETL